MRKILILIVVVLLVTTMQAQSYSLEEIKKLALENNNSLKNSKLEFEASKYLEKNTFTKYFPTVSVNAFKMNAENDVVQTTLMGAPISMVDNMTLASLSAVQPVFVGGRIVNGNKLAKLARGVSEEQIILKRNEVLKTTEEKYMKINSLNEKMKTLCTYEKMLDDLYKEASDANKAGLILRNDLLKISLKQNEIQISKLQLSNAISLSQKALCQYVGVPLDTNIVLTDSIGVLDKPESIYVQNETALPNRIEYKLLQKKLTSEKLQTKLKIGEYLPTISVGATEYQLKMLDDTKNNLLVFANVSIPLSDWWGGAYSLQERKVIESKVRSEVKDNLELLSLQMDKNWDDLSVAYQQIEYADKAILQAEENVKINNENYKSGTINISDMLEAQALLQSSRDHLVEAKLNYRMAYIEYLQNTGRY